LGCDCWHLVFTSTYLLYLFMNICHLSHEVYSVHNALFYSIVNSSTQKLFLFIMFHLHHPLNGAEFISLGFCIYIYFVQKFAKTIFNSVILAQLIVLLNAISSFMCNHLLLKKIVPSISMSLYSNSIFMPFSSSLCSAHLCFLHLCLYL